METDQETVQHLFFRLKERCPREIESDLESLTSPSPLRGVLSLIFGHRADFAVMMVSPSPDEILQKSKEFIYRYRSELDLVDSYLSVTEYSEYTRSAEEYKKELAAKMDPESPEAVKELEIFEKRMTTYKKERIHPTLPPPGKYFSFYPMAKKRDATGNWFNLPFEDRKKLMGAHGALGRKFADRVNQLITASTGLDDFEWGVTLFAVDLPALNEIVYKMRFDEASAIYGIFERFYTGKTLRIDKLAVFLKDGKIPPDFGDHG